jgi:hypothetical protein
LDVSQNARIPTTASQVGKVPTGLISYKYKKQKTKWTVKPDADQSNE